MGLVGVGYYIEMNIVSYWNNMFKYFSGSLVRKLKTISKSVDF
jgi:hypothetical protein